jgi:hypothetical protein
MKEWKAGRWVSQKQALAVSYSQAKSYMKKRTRSRTYKRFNLKKRTRSRKYSTKYKRSNLKRKSKRK